jgi:hypothetical protein
LWKDKNIDEIHGMAAALENKKYDEPPQGKPCGILIVALV